MAKSSKKRKAAKAKAKAAAAKITTKDGGYGIGVPVSSSPSPSPSYGSNPPQSNVVQTPPPKTGAMYWPAPTQWYQQGKEATKKAILEYVNGATQIQQETEQDRKIDLVGKMNLAIQSIIQGIAIATEAAELQTQRKRTGDQSASFELAVTEDSLKRLLKILWVHNYVAKKAVYPGLEIKLMESQLTGRINRTTAIHTNDDGLEIEIDKGEDPNLLWMTDYTPPAPGQQGAAEPTTAPPPPGADQASPQPGDTPMGAPPTPTENIPPPDQGAAPPQEPLPEQQPVQAEAPPAEEAGAMAEPPAQPPAEEPGPDEDAIMQQFLESQQPPSAEPVVPEEEGAEGGEPMEGEPPEIETPVPEEEPPVPEEAPEEEMEEEAPVEEAAPDVQAREMSVLEREKRVAEREASVAAREQAAGGASPAPEPEPVEEETPEGEEAPEGDIEEETPTEGEAPVEEAPEEEVETEEAPEEEVSEEEETPEEGEPEEEGEDEEETRYCIECDMDVTPEEIAECSNPKCPFASQASEEGSNPDLEPEEEEELKHFVMMDTKDHSDHNCQNIVLREYTGVHGEFCLDCQKLISYSFDDTWTAPQVKGWVEKSIKKKEFIEKTPEDLVVESLDHIPDEEIIAFIEEKAGSGNVEGAIDAFLNIPEDELSELVSKSVKEAYAPVTEKIGKLGQSAHKT